MFGPRRATTALAVLISPRLDARADLVRAGTGAGIGAFSHHACPSCEPTGWRKNWTSPRRPVLLLEWTLARQFSSPRMLTGVHPLLASVGLAGKLFDADGQPLYVREQPRQTALPLQRSKCLVNGSASDNGKGLATLGARA